MSQLSKNGNTMFNTLCNEYVSRIKRNVPQDEARIFDDVDYLKATLFQDWEFDEINTTIYELKNAFLVETSDGNDYIDNIVLPYALIKKLENKIS